MSRVAKKPIALPKGVECQVAADGITVKGPKGTLKMHAIPGVEIKNEAGHLTCADGTAETKFAGTTRALLANMVQGVSQGYERKLELVGVGFRAAVGAGELAFDGLDFDAGNRVHLQGALGPLDGDAVGGHLALDALRQRDRFLGYS
jgi:ribosomal protein L6P/L9E